MEHRYLSLDFFDCSLYIGRPAKVPTVNREITPSSLKEELGELAITGGLVTHVTAREYHPAAGNPLLLQQLNGHPELAPCWVLLPHHTGEMAEPRPLVRSMLASGVRAARVYPGIANGDGHRFPLHRLVVGELFAELERNRIPLFIDYLLGRRDDVNWGEVAEVCERHPKLPVILIRSSGRSSRTLHAFMRALPNLHMEISFYHAHRGIEALVEDVGPERILFGSNYPYNTLPAPVFRVAHSLIPLEAKRLIAGGNLRRLLAGVREGGVPV